MTAKGTSCWSPARRRSPRRLSAWLAQGAEAVGVCFLWSFRNACQRAAGAGGGEQPLPGALPDAVQRPRAGGGGVRARLSTVALNARLEPVVTSYLRQLQKRLQDHSFQGAIMLMQAHGGLLEHGRCILEGGRVHRVWAGRRARGQPSRRESARSGAGAGRPTWAVLRSRQGSSVGDGSSATASPTSFATTTRYRRSA